ncbi:P-loop containing nucleoside triphosphate hydrolase protein [Piptocephalis cylindrospora]|uniref:RNA helicase n=1 Tax=Piptocephalis cylindrospora TaxID=1907219 RepID=A0A4P9Y1F1_9FUNG|nr:P-loop containing nucleoside triphosphate hydrolase protein [Piptocephalis cylindrospora]|eukprot:RKP11891.1 P-loop containing nucleoside triphosphate hydrolase protein [Piptocephalis cylindrospora]
MRGFIHLDDFNEAKAGHAPTFQLSSKSSPETPATEEEKKDAPVQQTRTLPTVPDVDIGAWLDFDLKAPILDALRILGFTKPTPIQAKALPLGLARRDIIGAAATGSGKTLAYGIPILQHLIRTWKNTPKTTAGSGPSGSPALAGLILTPTRELATQVKDHMVALAQCTPQPTHILPIVGGMSIQKQERVLSRHPHIIVATPGRLWELMEGNDSFLLYLRTLSFLVIDEADRMFETGHFRELTSILKAISRRSVSDGGDFPKAKGAKDGEANLEVTPPSTQGAPKPPRRQTFVFSATLGKDFLSSAKEKKGKGSGSKVSDDPMKQLLRKVEFDDSNRQIVDVTVQGAGGAKASTLIERRVDCIQTDKEILLYYFLLRFPCRTLVFVNSIDAARRILPSLQLLQLPVFGLHGQMQQRARLRSLERFRDHDNAILIATDVAARGLDIPEVEHVIHYQVPRSKGTYVHRSGRTARAGHEGLSTIFCGAEEVKAYKALMGVLGKGGNIPEFPVDRGLVTSLRERVVLARKINAAEHKESKAKHEEDWMRKQAEAMDIILDESMIGGGSKGKGKKGWVEEEEGDEANAGKQLRKVAQWKSQLQALMGSSVIPRGASAKYPTSGHVRDLPARLMLEGNKSGLRGHKQVSIMEAVRQAER